MKNYKSVTIVEDKLANLLQHYVDGVKNLSETFEKFSDESVLYALLEYSKYPRDYTSKERIKYILEKICQYENIDVVHSSIKITENEYSQYEYYDITYRTVEEQRDRLPF